MRVILETIEEVMSEEVGEEKAKISEAAVIIKHVGRVALRVRIEVIVGGVAEKEEKGPSRENREVVALSTTGKEIGFKGLRCLS